MEVAKDDKKKAKSSVDASMNAFVLSLEERSRIAQAKFLLYSPGHQSKAVLTNPYFRSMLQSCNFGKGEVPILGYKQVASYAEAEFKLMFDLIKLLLSEQEQLAVGNKYLQVIHDGCTAANKRKYQAIGIQFVDPRWRRNHAITIGFVRCHDGRAEGVANLIKELLHERLDRKLNDVANLMVSDGAAKKVAEYCEIDEVETCMMHDGDKIGQSATGKLVRSIETVVVNPFDKGLSVVKKAHAVALWFSIGDRTSKLFEAADSLQDSDVPKVRLQLDHNTTRVAAQHRLLFSLIRMNKSLKMFELSFVPHMKSGKTYPKIEGEEWTAMFEIEAVLYQTQKITLLAQHEEAFCGSYAPVIQQKVNKALMLGELLVVDIDQICSSPKLPRVKKPFDSFSAVGRQCWLRAIVELQRRFCGNKLNVPLPTKNNFWKFRYNQLEFPESVSVQQHLILNQNFDEASPVITNRELIAMCLDLRLVVDVSQYISIDKAIKATRTAYIEFFCNAEEYKRRSCEGGNNAGSSLNLEQDQQQSKSTPSTMNDEGLNAWELFLGKNLSVDEPVISDGELLSREDLETLGGNEFDSILPEWIKYARSIDWRKEFGDELKDSLNDGEAIDVVDHLLPLNIGKLYVKAHRMNKFGYLPSMASSSSGQLGALMAESYCERIISVGNMISTDRNVLLNDDELEMLVVLKMNKEFIEFMRNNYAHEIKKKFGQRFNESSTSGP